MNTKSCKKCNKNRMLDRQKVHSELCHSCYRKQERSIQLLRTDRTCVKCTTQSSVKWYSGPLCRSCFRNYNYSKNKKLSTESHKINRLKNNLRSRISKIISGVVKQGSAIYDLGCSIEEFKRYIQSKFQSGMTWDNYGHKTWHIDHIKPLSSFDLTDPKQLKEACHYTNLQPLWAKDNLEKSDKWQK